MAWSSWLATQLRDAGIDVVSLCPGVTDTALSASMLGHRAGDSPSQAADLVERAIWSKFGSGTYLEGGRPALPSSFVRDLGNQRRLPWLIADRTGHPLPAEQ